ncbi:helix-turn-helix domain-containing protein [Rhodovulum sp. P5]|uniref:helix-turn-helix domain-containing protein n=1 Tax=Rhodovulum sp. P5 TaxID=1564506 RepID=UPI0009DAED82|nr:helix-turn-helix domain-containing protein [Rhodovulum sp. P5]
MMTYLHSQTAKAELTAALEKDKAAQQVQDQSPLKTKKDIRGFWAQFPKTRDLFGEIMNKWRKSGSRRPGHEGFWAAWPYRDWSAATGLPIATLKRHLNTLEENGLIERTLGRHGGSRVLTFIRPTPLALYLSDVKAGDWQRLGIPLQTDFADTLPPSVLEANPELLEG